MSRHPYPNADRARNQIARHPRPKPLTMAEALDGFSAVCAKLGRAIAATTAARREDFTTRA